MDIFGSKDILVGPYNRVSLPQPSLKIPGFPTSGHTHTPKWGQGVFFTDGCASLANCFEAKAHHRQTSAVAVHKGQKGQRGGGDTKGFIRSQIGGKCIINVIQFHVCGPVWSPFTSEAHQVCQLASGFSVTALLKLPSSNVHDWHICFWITVSTLPCYTLYRHHPRPPSPALAEWNNHLIRSLTKHQSWCKANMKSKPPECEIYLSTNLECSPGTLRCTQFANASGEPLWSYII